MAKILVSGAAGYIGSICSQLLLEAGHQVWALDNLERSTGKNIPQEATFVHSCIADEEKISTLLNAHNFDAVLHFAAFIEVAESVAKPELYEKNNYQKSKKFIDLCLLNGIKSFVFSSTAAVYGSPRAEDIPLKETAPLEPINPYGEYKLKIEKYLAEKSNSSFNYIAFRYFNVAGAYGELGEEHEPETHVIPLAIDAALGKRDKFYLFGEDYATRDGSALRDYVHVKDLAMAHINALDFFAKDEALLNRAYNLGSGQGYTVKEVFAAVEKVTDKKIPLILADRRPGDPASLLADSSAAQKIGLFKPEHNNIEKIVVDAYQHRKNYHGS